MDFDLWICRLPMKKRHDVHHHQLQGSSSNRLGFEEFEIEKEIQSEFSCPHCYEEHDIMSLGLHLGEENPFESKVVVSVNKLWPFLHCIVNVSILHKEKVCPICSVKVSKDMVNHLGEQHRNLFNLQRRRRLRRFSIPRIQTRSLLGRGIREAHLQVLLGSGGYRSNNNSASNLTVDSLLSSLILNFPTSEADESAKTSISTVGDHCKRKDSPLLAWGTRFESSLTYEEREHQRKQAAIRSSFVQDLLLSALFAN